MHLDAYQPFGPRIKLVPRNKVPSQHITNILNSHLRTKMLLIRVAGRQKTMTRISAMAKLTIK